jgi:HSP20 family protein
MAQDIRKPETGSASPSWDADPFAAIRSEVDRIFDSFMRPGWIRPSPFRDTDDMMKPSVDVCEEDSQIIFEAELPGMSEKDIEVTVREGVLTLRGEKKFEREDAKADYRVSERSYGRFERSFRLPEGSDTDNISAEFERGVLTIRVPKKVEPEKVQKKIEVKAA